MANVLSKLSKDQWITVAGWGTSAILAAVFGGLVTSYFTSKPDLYWNASEVLPFKGEKEEVGVFNLKIQNGGSKEVEEVDVLIKMPSGAFDEARVSPEIMAASREINGDKLSIRFKLLNPNESVQVSALVRSKESIPQKPIIEVRGKGVKGYESVQAKNDTAISVAILILSLFTSAYIGIGAYRRRRVSSMLERNIKAVEKQLKTLKEQKKYLKMNIDKVETYLQLIERNGIPSITTGGDSEPERIGTPEKS